MQLPSEVNDVMNRYMESFKCYFPNELEGVYLHGSIALGAYTHGLSDIDFITVTKHRFTSSEIKKVSELHKEIKAVFRETELDGVYMTKDDIGKLYHNGGGTNDEYLYYNEGEATFGRYFNFNPITWWLFKEQGISVYGKETSVFSIEVEDSQLRDYVLKNMNTYWVNRAKRLEKDRNVWDTYTKGEVDEEIEWTVLGSLRQFYTLRENDVISKIGAGTYGLRHLAEKWHPVIKEAINIRERGEATETENSEVRLKELVDFSKYLIEISNIDCRK
jgi:hypothetical protein